MGRARVRIVSSLLEEKQTCHSPMDKDAEVVCRRRVSMVLHALRRFGRGRGVEAGEGERQH